MNGNTGVSEGATKSGLDVYYFYPMTPATNVAGELAEKQIERKELSMFWNRMLGALSNYVEPKTWKDCIEVARGDGNGS